MATYQITAPDGSQYKITAPTDEAAMAAVNDLLGSAKPAEKTSTGFATRENREAAMPETPDLARELDITKRMAANRKDFGAEDVYKQGLTFGLRDEVGALGTAVTDSILGGQNFGDAYSNAKEADRRLREEYAGQHPVANAAATVGGLLTGGMGAAGEKVLTGAAAKAPTLLQSMGQGAAINGAQGAVQGAAEGDEADSHLFGLLPGGRIGGAISGGLTGVALGGAAPAVIAGVKAAASPITNTVRAAINPEKAAAQQVAAARARDLARGEGLDDAAFAAAQAKGQPVAVIDSGGSNVHRLARAAGNQSPEAWSAMDDVIRPRFSTQVERLDDVLKGESKLPAGDFLDQAEVAARKANAPAYRKAEALGSGNVWDDTLEQLAGAPAMQKALKGAIAKAADNAIIDGFGAMNPRVSVDDFGNLVFRDKGGMPAYPDLRLWDLTKRELDRMGKMAARNSDSDARIYQTLAKKLTEHLDSLGEMGKAYKAARQTAASFFGAENAYEAGMKYASAKGMNAREAVKGMSKLKPEERNLFREGYIQAKRDQLAELRSNRDATLTVMNSKGDVERARVALGKDGAQRLQAQLEVEQAMDAARKAFGNSQTARQLVELGLFSAAGSGVAAYNGNTDIGSLTVGALGGAATKWGRGKINERMMAEVGKLLASQDPKKIQALVKIASKSPQYLEAIRLIRTNLTGTAARAISSP